MKTESTYEQQAAAFLTNYGVTFTIKPAAHKRPAWAAPGEHYGNRNRYRVALAHPRRSPVRFDFWGSIRDAESGERPTAYSVLACLSGDINCSETFEDFCADYGYEDSREAEATFRRCAVFAEKLRGFFPEGEERDALQEIQ